MSLPDLEELIPSLYQKKAKAKNKTLQSGNTVQQTADIEGFSKQKQSEANNPNVITMLNEKGEEVLMQLQEDGTMKTLNPSVGDVSGLAESEDESDECIDEGECIDEVDDMISGLENDEDREKRFEESMKVMEAKYKEFSDQADEVQTQEDLDGQSEKPSDQEEKLHTPSSVSKYIRIADLKDQTFQGKIELLMDRLLMCCSSKDVDDWCLEFCDLNSKETRERLLEVIQENYRKSDRQPFLARAIKELKPAFPTISKEVDDIVIVSLID